ncbi:MAG: MlaD family protein [Acidobacteria bacterium]|nr:MlaD family protein [Acidobacteriota bacterium]MCA1649091.1 MlaD family protein [Acidobacteriota bacterium]
MQANKLAAVGAFVIGGLVLFAVGLFLIGDRRMMFSNTFDIYAEFSNIAALENGSTVRVAGMDAGEVETIHVPTGPTGRFRVKMRLREDLRPLIRLDSVAAIQNDGLVGNKFVHIEAGSEGSAAVLDNGTIQSREPFDLANVLEKMSTTIDIVNTTIVDIHGRVQEAFGTLATTATEAQALLDDIGKGTRSITASTQRVTADLNAIISGIREGRGTVGKFVTDDAFYRSLQAMAADAEKAVASVREASEQAKGAVADFRGEGGAVKGLAGDVQQTLVSARDAMADVADTTEALKRSFFFRGFFNRRGYFDLDDVSVQQYREGALESRDRKVLRIWLSSRVLYEKDANGNERLTDGGRARIDSAMSQFVQYPRTTPFVVEGYAQQPSGDTRFVLSRTRAKLVRDYVVGKFGLDPNFVAIMPLGAEAAGSPDGQTWDGVALALFVSRKS